MHARVRTPHPRARRDPARANCTTDPHIGAQPARDKAWGTISNLLSSHPGISRNTVAPATAQLITNGVAAGGWSRVAKWLTKFRDFLLQRAGRPLHHNELFRTMGSNTAALDFLAAVHQEGKGRTRPGAASRAIDFLRCTLGLTPLSEDPRTSMLTKAALRATPHVPHGANRLPEVMIRAVADSWRCSCWRRR